LFLLYFMRAFLSIIFLTSDIACFASLEEFVLPVQLRIIKPPNIIQSITIATDISIIFIYPLL
ncbi:hypothetical protein DQQ52_25435, partial [Salmonella enterica subsp. enterica serovar Schwarzengrund]|nr:hypothetical protein [Salmonella enterica subsp. enterica serovar Schwarzengrund]